MTSLWTREAIARIAAAPIPFAPLIELSAVHRVLPGFDLWDYWPVQERDGSTATIAGGALQMLLAAPVLDDPDARHGIARIRLMHQTASGWRDLGHLFPDGFSPGSREWSGSAIIDADHSRITLYFTVAGRRGEPVLSFEQRLFETAAPLRIVDGAPQLGPWSIPVESVAADGLVYQSDMSGGGAIGTIKAFRDPAWFQDPADGQEYLVFAGSLARSVSAWNGAVGIARRAQGQWALADPLITADGLNNELERPHTIFRGGRYYCFWSTQAKVFASDGPRGPNGLYGMVADQMAGPWRPLNGSGLVFANPAASPVQAYSWLVLNDLSVIAFVDRPGLPAEPADPVIARRHFGGTPAQPLQLALDGDLAVLV
ncbi:glycoside hydrolase family 68 protein [Novosphingobium sp. Chol11]|uniref:glycoside hydrolase family 68 protein n=1 Tax=Novosphingobium sp. Chol11 TaxID=1385763 RepID=UPI0025FC4921|nr:glycoside hydrolase family 68 protein [Novosphingobium sp. Chol11]